MPTISYFYQDGTNREIEVNPGTSIMRGAVSQGLPGIIGECGGQAMCATCHVYVRSDYLDRLPTMSEDEEEMLEDTAALPDENRSRLGCQIRVGPLLEHIEVDVPEEQ